MIALSRSVTIDIIWAVFGGICTVIFCYCVFSCAGAPSEVNAAKYQIELEECNRQAKTLCESVVCENIYRKTVNHTPRKVPEHCKPLTADGTQIIIKDGGF